MVKKSIPIISTVLILSLNLASAYIDPGTGGYLASSLFSSILTILAVIFAAVAAFFSRHLINPIKHLYHKNKKLFFFILAILLLSTAFAIYHFIPKTPKFDPSLSGAHIYNINKIYPSYELYEGKLMDLNGNVIKKWNSTYLGVIDKNGDYYAQQYYESPTWGRYSWNDSIIWEMKLPIHHEILLTPENTIITFTKEVHEYNGRKVEFDVILELDKNGTTIYRLSTWDNLKYFQQFHKPLELDQAPNIFIPEDHKKNMSIWGGEYDYYHLNSISLVPNNSLQGTHPAFTPANWIISFRHGSMIFILDKETKEVLWRAIYDQVPGNLEGPHTPMMTQNGNIIVLDNGRYRGWSRIISINPITLNITWEYKTASPQDFFSLSQSSIQLLPNYNLLVTESEKGRVFELTPDKEIVWEFLHPDKQNKTNSNVPEKYGQRQEIYRMISYDKSFIDNLMKNN
jgi:hypothetical protein